MDFRYFREPSAFAQEYLVCSDAMGYERSPNFSIDRARFENSLVMVVLDGKLVVEQYGARFVLGAGEGVLMRLYERHRYWSDTESPCRLLWFHFRGRPLNALMERLEEERTLPLRFPGEELIAPLCRCFDVAAERAPGYEVTLSSLFYSMVVGVIGRYVPRAAIEAGGNNSSFVRCAERYVEEHLYGKPNLEEAARAAHVSKYHYCRMFRSHFGKSFLQYVTARKIEAAQFLLAYTGDRPGEIAQKLGFADPGHFSKSFHAHVGCTPSQYRAGKSR